MCNYGAFVELKDSDGRKYRRSKDNLDSPNSPYSNNVYIFCSQRDGKNFVSDSIFGVINYETPEESTLSEAIALSRDQEIIEQMDSMISSITKYGY